MLNFQPIYDWLVGVKQWFVDTFIGLIADLLNLLFDLFVWIVGQLFYLILLVVNIIPAPDLASGVTLNSILSSMPNSVMYLFGQIHLVTGLAMISSAYVFYFFRRLLTVGIW